MAENEMSERDQSGRKLDARFFAQQLKCIVCAHDRLERTMLKGLEQLDRRMAGSEERLTEAISRVEGKLDQFTESQSKSRSRTPTSRRLRPSKRRR